LGLDGIEPQTLRERGRQEARAYGVQLFDSEVTGACCNSKDHAGHTSFEIRTNERAFTARALLLTTGIVDELPDIPNLADYYGRSVHHCPYCDGWEHRDQHLAAVGTGDSAVKLALSLSCWSEHVALCSNGAAIDPSSRQRLAANGVSCRQERIQRLEGKQGALSEINFAAGPSLKCEALFFSADKGQRSPLAETLGCQRDEEDLVQTQKKQRTFVDGLFVAGDADGDVQFAIVAAAEGATAATAINTLLQKQDLL
jgi:thioredoxin reductase